MLTGDYFPVPDKLTVRGLPAALPFPSSTAELLPVAWGASVLLAFLLVRPLSVLPQVVDDSAKSSGSVPENVAVVRVMSASRFICCVSWENLFGVFLTAAWRICAPHIRADFASNLPPGQWFGDSGCMVGV